LAFVPARPGFQFAAPTPRNYIDERIFDRLRVLRMNPSPLCTDSAFVRRAFLDVIGVLPTAAEAREFVQGPRPDKRARCVDLLLQRPEFGDHWALKWADLLRAEERLLDRKGLELFHDWLRDSFNSGKLLDVFARELVGATGSTYQHPAANFYRAVREPAARAEAVAQVFLGTRLNCAQCHNHPFDRWTQDDYYDWAGAFAHVDYKILENRRRDSNDKHEFKGEQIVFVSSKGSVSNPRTRRPARSRMLGTAETNERADPPSLADVAAWVGSAENPFFARAQANRIWFHLMGRGLVDPIDDFRHTNPASHPALLEALAADFVSNRFNLRALIRRITSSAAYQLSPVPNDTNGDDDMHYARAYVWRLGAEQLLDCQSQVLGVPLALAGYPPGTRAVQMAGALSEQRRGQRSADADQFLATFGKPPRLLTCECERSGESTMAQAFQMISGPTVVRLFKDASERFAAWETSGVTSQHLVDELYWSALSRAPSLEELSAMSSRIASAKTRREGIEDVAWALLNAKEFMLRH